MKKNTLYLFLIIISISCDPTSQETTYLKGSITTHDVADIEETTAKCGGKVIIESQGNTADNRMPEKGIMWSLSKERIQELSDFSIDKEYGMNNTPYQDNNGDFLCKMTELKPNTKYYVRAFARIGVTEKKYVYGNIKEFSTTKTGAVVETLPVSNITATIARLNGTITNAGIPIYSERGFCYSQSIENPTINNEKVSVENPLAVFIGQYKTDIDITKFTKNTHYKIRAYVVNADEVSYGKTVELKAEVPVVTIKGASNISANSVTLEAVFTNIGIPLSSEWGFYYSETSDFLVNNTTKQNVEKIDNNGNYSYTLDNIKPNTRYYYYAYATNVVETISSEIMSFMTQESPPKVVTLTASNITATSATVAGQITNIGAPIYTERGICCSRITVPTIDDNEYKIIITGNDANIFSANLTNLIDGNVYNVRAYAIWNEMPIYGENIRFVPYSYKTVSNLAVQKTDLGIELWNSANNLCASSILGGKKWRLPTISELQILYTHRNEIGNFETERSGFTYYWSSTLQSTSHHLYLDFNGGSIDRFGNKFNDDTFYGNVRCVCELSE